MTEKYNNNKKKQIKNGYWLIKIMGTCGEVSFACNESFNDKINLVFFSFPILPAPHHYMAYSTVSIGV